MRERAQDEVLEQKLIEGWQCVKRCDNDTWRDMMRLAEMEYSYGRNGAARALVEQVLDGARGFVS